jgi:hypothetical protein
VAPQGGDGRHRGDGGEPPERTEAEDAPGAGQGGDRAGGDRPQGPRTKAPNASKALTRPRAAAGTPRGRIRKALRSPVRA